jgi:hypothetical protein
MNLFLGTMMFRHFCRSTKRMRQPDRDRDEKCFSYTRLDVERWNLFKIWLGLVTQAPMKIYILAVVIPLHYLAIT